MVGSHSPGLPTSTADGPSATQRYPALPSAQPSLQRRHHSSASPVRRSGSPSPQPPGSSPTAPLHGPRGAHAPRVIDVRIATELRPDGTGHTTLTPLALRQARFPASTPMQLAAAVEMVRTELEIAGYERWKGFRPSIAELGDADHDAVSEPKPVAPAPPPYLNRHEQAWRTGGNDRERDPSEYAWRADGTVTSPGGKHIRNPDAIERVRRRCRLAGASTAPEVYDLGDLGAAVTAAATAVGRTEHDWVCAAVGEAVKRQAKADAKKASGEVPAYRPNRGAEALRATCSDQVPLFPSPVPSLPAAVHESVVEEKPVRRLRSAS